MTMPGLMRRTGTRRYLAGAFAGALLVAMLTGPALAGKSWGLIGEEIVRFDARVVDVLCELTGDCPADCGGGERQLGLVTDAGELILPFKNTVPFAGAAGELIEFCGKLVTADGLFANNRGHRIFALQFVREAPDGKWRAANRWINKWAADNGVDAGSKAAKQWFRNDPRVRALIGAHGVTGLGPE
jgi:hypothetical protein